jgi:hypothetical protein
MRKRLVTICWTTTVLKEIPDHITDEQLLEADFGSPKDVHRIAYEVVKEAYDNTEPKYGEIISIQDE